MRCVILYLGKVQSAVDVFDTQRINKETMIESAEDEEGHKRASMCALCAPRSVPTVMATLSKVLKPTAGKRQVYCYSYKTDSGAPKDFLLPPIPVNPQMVPTLVLFDVAQALSSPGGLLDGSGNPITTAGTGIGCKRWWSTNNGVSGTSGTDYADVMKNGTVVTMTDGKPALQIGAPGYLREAFNQYTLSSYAFCVILEPLSLPGVGQTAVLWAGSGTPWFVKLTSTTLSVWNSSTTLTHKWTPNQRAQGVNSHTLATLSPTWSVWRTRGPPLRSFL